MNFLISDTETGGIYPAVHALLSIGAVCSWHADPFIVYITPESQPGKSIDPQAAQKNGYTPELWAERGAVALAEGFQLFIDYVAARRAERDGVAMWCHNLAFDRGFYCEAERVTSIQIPHRHDWRCSQSKFGELMDKQIIPSGSSGLDRLIALSEYCKPRGETHDALEDCYATLHGLAWLLEKEKGEKTTLRQLYSASIHDRRRLEDIIVQMADLMDMPLEREEGRQTASKLANLICQEATRVRTLQFITAEEAKHLILDGAELINRERQRQRSKEGWTSANDDEHVFAELAVAANQYISFAAIQVRGETVAPPGFIPPNWPWDPEWWKPGCALKNLIKGGALIAAEIDRLLRKGGQS